MKNYNECLEKLKEYGQEHLLHFYEELTEEEKKNLLEQINLIDFEEIQDIICKSSSVVNSKDMQLETIEAIDKYNLTEEKLKQYKDLGKEMIKNGKIAVCTMAGGQGTRLGHIGPKGTFIVPLKEPKSIFQISTEHLLKAYETYGVYVNWYIMTSEDNDIETKKFFEENNYFTYPKEKIKFFKQAQLPLTNLDGRILLRDKGEIYRAANGNGGIFKALEDNRILKEMQEQGIEFLAVGNVDNILIKPVDDVLIGALAENHTELAIKSIIKRSPDEPVGVCCLKNGRPTVIEYIDLPKDLAEAKNDDGTLKYGEVHFGSNYLSVKLLERIAKEKLPYHCARKKNSYLGVDGNLVEANEINSIKAEMFIFDGFEKAESAIVFRTRREEEFAPIKNKEGQDSPFTAIEMYEKQKYRFKIDMSQK